jgi:hypothetical protein
MCGKVRYEVEGPPEWVGNCHCSLCRRHHGAAYGTYAGYRPERFRVTAGQEELRSYSHTGETRRQFCATCGSSLFFLDADPPREIAITLGTLTDDPGKRPEFHYLASCKASWHEITDDLPRRE